MPVGHVVQRNGEPGRGPACAVEQRPPAAGGSAQGSCNSSNARRRSPAPTHGSVAKRARDPRQSAWQKQPSARRDADRMGVAPARPMQRRLTVSGHGFSRAAQEGRRSHWPLATVADKPLRLARRLLACAASDAQAGRPVTGWRPRLTTERSRGTRVGCGPQPPSVCDHERDTHEGRCTRRGGRDPHRSWVAAAIIRRDRRGGRLTLGVDVDLGARRVTDKQLGAAERISDVVGSWPEVDIGRHRSGGVEFRLGRREHGHLHGDRIADLPFPRRVRDELIAAGRARRHHRPAGFRMGDVLDRRTRRCGARDRTVPRLL